MDFIATQKYVLTSPKKLREVSILVKGLKPMEALDKLPFVGKRATEPLRKVIMTAIANAKQKGISDTELVFKEVQIMEGPRLKRFRAGARGRAKPYKRRMSHIRIVLQTTEKPKVTKEAKKEIKNVESKKLKNQKETKAEKAVKSEKTERKNK